MTGEQFIEGVKVAMADKGWGEGEVLPANQDGVLVLFRRGATEALNIYASGRELRLNDNVEALVNTRVARALESVPA